MVADLEVAVAAEDIDNADESELLHSPRSFFHGNTGVHCSGSGSPPGSGSGAASRASSNIPQSAITAVVVGTPSDSIGLPTCSSN